MDCVRVLALLFLLGSMGICQTTNPSGRTFSSPASDLSQYRIESVFFEGSRSFSSDQLKRAFNVPIGGKFNDTAIGQGLERLKQLYGDDGYINFTAVPQLQLNRERGTIVLTISIDDGLQFTFGRLILAGQETRAGEADALRNGWAALSGRRYNSSLLRKWLIQNAAFLPNDGQPLRHVKSHQSSDTRQADIEITFTIAKS
jgi:hypothetical protein